MVRWLLFFLLLSLTTLSFPNLVEAGNSAQENVNSAINASERISVFVRVNDQQNTRGLGKQDIAQNQLIARNELVKNYGASYEYKSQNAFNTRLTKEEIEALQNDPSVEIFIAKPVQKQLQDSVPLIKANSTWELQSKGSNLTGHGQTVCVLDTGVDYTHPSLGGCLGEGCKVLAGRNIIDSNTNITDVDGHGTHVAGIVAADGAIRGVAPGVNIVGVKVLNDNGDGTTADIAAGIDWCTNNSETYNISVISMSLGTPPPYVYSTVCDDTFGEMTTAIQAATAKNISVISSAGNDGLNDSISAPACISGVIPVGSTTKNDQISSFSNRNSLVELFAPGSLINSTLPGGAFGEKSGTSMAAPHVSGAYAILRQYQSIDNLQNTTEELETLLFDTREATLQENNNTYGRIDLFSATKELLLAPVTNATFAQGWQNESFNVTLTVTFNTTTINRTTYIINDSEFNGTELTISQEGNQTITFYSIDNNNIRETNKTINALLDLTTPNTTITNHMTQWVAGPYVLSFNASDNLSGINKTISNLSTNDSQETFNTTNITVNRTGNYSLFYYSIDIAGNKETEKNTTILVDMTQPTLNITSPTGWQNETFTINWTANDLHSGMNRTEYYLDNQTVIATNLTINESGNLSIMIRAIDQVNNTNETTITALLDLSAPNTTLIANEGWQNTNQTISFNATDNLSGVNTTQTHLGDGNWTETTNLNLSDGNHTVFYRSIDVVGNIEGTKNQTILIDTTTPIVNLSNNNTFPSSNETIEFMINVTEENLDTVTLLLDDVEQNLTVNGSIFTMNTTLEIGNHDINLTVTDKANNSYLQQTRITVYNKKKLENLTVNSTTIDTKNETNANLQLKTNATIQANVTLLSSEEKPIFIVPDLENVIRYVTIQLSDNLKQNLTWAKVSVFYSQEEIEGLDESTLRLIYYNESSDEWHSLGTLDFVLGTGTDENEVWVNTTRFSTYALVGDEEVVTPTISTNSGGGGGGSGGGGIATDSTTSNSSTQSTTFLSVGNPRTINFNNENLAIRSLTFTPGNELFSATFSLEKKEIPDDAPENTREYYELSYPSDLIAQEVIIRYITNISSPKLYRYSDEWYALEQEKTNESEYLAYSEGLSRFAIVEEPSEQKTYQNTSETNETTNTTKTPLEALNVIESNETILNETEEQVEESQNSGGPAILVVLLVLLLLVVTVYVYSKRPQ